MPKTSLADNHLQTEDAMTEIHNPAEDASPPCPPELFRVVAPCRACGRHHVHACVDEETGLLCWWAKEDPCSPCAAGIAAEADPAIAGLYAEDAA